MYEERTREYLRDKGYEGVEVEKNEAKDSYSIHRIVYKTKKFRVQLDVSYCCSCCGIKSLRSFFIMDYSAGYEKEISQFILDVARATLKSFNCGAVNSIHNETKWKYFEDWDVISTFNNPNSNNVLKHYQLLNTEL